MSGLPRDYDAWRTAGPEGLDPAREDEYEVEAMREFYRREEETE